MRTQFSKFAVAATFGLALAFTFSCSSGGGGDGNFEYGLLSYQGKTYKTVKIGNQVWMAENLNYNVKGSKCYNNQESYCDKYGKLYDWATAMGIDAKYNKEEWGGSDVKHQGICPSGWHIPSKNDWEELINYVENENECSDCAGKYLKAKSGWDDYEGKSGNGLDTYGFSALPGGGSDDLGRLGGAGSVGGWWSASTDNSVYAGLWFMFYSLDGVETYGGKYVLQSVRCVKDSPSRSSSSNSSLRSSSSIGGSEQSYNYCITAAGCLVGPFTISTCTGQLSNSCPNSSSSSMKSSSSSVAVSSASVQSSSSILKCNGQNYTPPNQRCENNVVETKCGSDWYNASTQFCHTDNTIHYKCNGSNYNASTQYCFNNTTPKNYGSVTYEGKTYKTVIIGSQTWMAENLNYNTSGSICLRTCEEYGSLYDWETAMSVCPPSWHLPSDDEWATLIDFVGGSSTAGTKLKATSGWWTPNYSYNGQDTYGFAALPGESVTNDPTSMVPYGYWWTATEYDVSSAYSQYMSTDVGRRISVKTDSYYSVRCVKN